VSALIETQGVKRHFADGRIVALDGVDLSIQRGEFVAVMGPSGSGKSTLLHLLGALDIPDEGHVLFDGERLCDKRDLTGFRLRTVGFVFQMHNLIPALRTWENVQMPLLEERMSPVARRERAVALLEEVDMVHRAMSLPSTLSSGERQRAAIARALVNAPEVVIADEPTGMVDSANAIRIMELLGRIQRERDATLVVVTHDADIAAWADRTVQLLDGRIVGGNIMPTQ
jgi:putative ABC transport system ATP-binding protein